MCKFPANFLVDPNCAPPAGDSILIPFARGAAVVAFARKNHLITVGVDCSDVHNVSPAEFVALTAAIKSYNTYISSQAAARGYAYFDPAFDPALRQWLARPFGRLFFAGEHTSFQWQGYMNGAVESGRRAAAEIEAVHRV